jgi:hypothetical protein
MTYRHRCISYGNASHCRSVPSSEAARGWSLLTDTEREAAFRRGELPYKLSEARRDAKSFLNTGKRG